MFRVTIVTSTYYKELYTNDFYLTKLMRLTTEGKPLEYKAACIKDHSPYRELTWRILETGELHVIDRPLNAPFFPHEVSFIAENRGGVLVRQAYEGRHRESYDPFYNLPVVKVK